MVKLDLNNKELDVLTNILNNINNLDMAFLKPVENNKYFSALRSIIEKIDSQNKIEKRLIICPNATTREHIIDRNASNFQHRIAVEDVVIKTSKHENKISYYDNLRNCRIEEYYETVESLKQQDGFRFDKVIIDFDNFIIRDSKDLKLMSSAIDMKISLDAYIKE